MTCDLLLVVSAVVLAAGLFFFALGAEALRRYSGSRLRDILRQRPASAARVDGRLAGEQDLLSAALAWLTLAELGLAVVLVALLEGRVAWPLGARLVAAMALTAAAMLVIRRGVASAVADHRAEETLIALLPVLGAAAVPMRPFVALERFVRKVVTRLMGEADASASPHEAIQEEILSAVDEGQREGVFAGGQAEMIESIIDLKELDVRGVMTPRTDLVWLPAEATLRDAARIVQESGHSRIPVFSGSRDNVVGILYAKDLLAPLAKPDGAGMPVTEVARRPLFVPETKPVWQLLHEFRSGRRHVAIVVDEYGGTAGLVTVEDILEEVVGEIDDEYDLGAPPPLKRLSATAAEVDGRMRVDELNSDLGTRVPEDEDYDTVGGLAAAALGHVPSVGERFKVENVEFTILEAGSHRVRRLRVEVANEEPESRSQNPGV